MKNFAFYLLVLTLVSSSAFADQRLPAEMRTTDDFSLAEIPANGSDASLDEVSREFRELLTQLNNNVQSRLLFGLLGHKHIEIQLLRNDSVEVSQACDENDSSVLPTFDAFTTVLNRYRSELSARVSSEVVVDTDAKWLRPVPNDTVVFGGGMRTLHRQPNALEARQQTIQRDLHAAHNEILEYSIRVISTE